MLRLLILKHIHNWSYAVLERAVRAKLVYRDFTRNVLIGMGERTSRPAISQLAATLCERGGAQCVIVGAMPKLRAAMHIDSVFTFADRDCVLIYPDIVNKIECFSYRTGAKKED